MLQRADRRRATSSSGPRRNQIATPTWADRIFGKHNLACTFRTLLIYLRWTCWFSRRDGIVVLPAASSAIKLPVAPAAAALPALIAIKRLPTYGSAGEG